jgi:spore germination protein KA
MKPNADLPDKEANPQNDNEQDWLQRLSKSNDFIHEHTSIKKENPFWLLYYRTLISSDILHQDVLPFLNEQLSLEELKSVIPVQEILCTNDAGILGSSEA